jgi:chorismate mutase/prephenate dehydratase
MRAAVHKTRAYAPGRERGILARLATRNGGPLRPAHVRTIFGEIISASRSLEQPLRVAYFGPEGTYTHLAARQQLGSAPTYVPALTIADVFREVEEGRCDVGVVPVENSTEGIVAHTLDLLVDSPLRIAAEVLLPVRHCLLARPGTSMRRVRRVAAHPQGLAQCRRWLGEYLPRAAIEEASSNAQAAARAAGRAEVAAIASEAAATTYGLAVLARGIQDEATNLTRFLVLGVRDSERPSGADRTSLVVSVHDEVGVLARLLRPFADHGVDLLKIESRPIRSRPWEYYFFLDLAGHRREPRVRRALAAVERRALRVTILGSYPAAPEVAT